MFFVKTKAAELLQGHQVQGISTGMMSVGASVHVQLRCVKRFCSPLKLPMVDGNALLCFYGELISLLRPKG